jgi:hypothetical protein
MTDIDPRETEHLEPATQSAYRRGRVAAASAVVLAALCLPATAAGASVGDGHTASFSDCHDQFSAIPVPIERAQVSDGDDSNDRVPEDYTIRPVSPADQATALLGLTILRCTVTVKGTLLPNVTLTYAGFEVEPLSASEHQEADLTGDFYLQFITTDSKLLADWLRSGTGLDVHQVTLDYRYTMLEPFAMSPFFFEAPAPPDWAFKVEGAAAAQMVDPPTLFADDNYWRDTKTPDGKTWSVRIVAPAHADYVAPATVTVTATSPGSELEKILAPPPPGNPATPPAFSVRQGPWQMTKKVFRK